MFFEPPRQFFLQTAIDKLQPLFGSDKSFGPGIETVSQGISEMPGKQLNQCKCLMARILMVRPAGFEPVDRMNKGQFLNYCILPKHLLPSDNRHYVIFVEFPPKRDTFLRMRIVLRTTGLRATYTGDTRRNLRFNVFWTYTRRLSAAPCLSCISQAL